MGRRIIEISPHPRIETGQDSGSYRLQHDVRKGCDGFVRWNLSILAVGGLMVGSLISVHHIGFWSYLT